MPLFAFGGAAEQSARYVGAALPRLPFMAVGHDSAACQEQVILVFLMVAVGVQAATSYDELRTLTGAAEVDVNDD